MVTVTEVEDCGRGYRGRGNRGRGRGDRPTCQLCYKYGHGAFHCWNCFDENFVQPPPPTSDSVANSVTQQKVKDHL